MVVTSQIEFDNNQFGIYFAGQVLSGKVTLTADKPKKVRGVSLCVSGYAYTHWSENAILPDTDIKQPARSQTLFYSGREDYIDSVTYLLGSEENDSLTIAPGIHTYNFACHLPVTCPSSFEGAYGQIRYVIKICLIRPWKFDQTFTKGFTVLKIMDLNFDSPLLRVPSNNAVTKVFCCGPCRSDPLQLEVHLAQTGYVPGQSIPITVIVTNDSRVTVEEIELSLVMLVCFYSQRPLFHCKNTRTTIAQFRGVGVLRHCKKQYYYELAVPATPPTCFNICRILQLTYEIIVEAKTRGSHENQLIAIPVTIGNVPLMGGVIQQQPVMMQRSALDNDATRSITDKGGNGEASDEMVNMKRINNSINETPRGPIEQREFTNLPWTIDANIPQPSFEEATHIPHACINADEKHDYSDGDFAPRYPVFYLSAATTPVLGVDETDAGGTRDGTWL